jgi:hypothetical protein
MKLPRTLRTLKQIISLTNTAVEPDDKVDDALLVSSVALVLMVLKMEVKSLPDEKLEPTLLLELAKLYQCIGDEPHALVTFQRAATFIDQNRGYYSDIGYCSEVLCRESSSEDFRLEIRSAVQILLEVCPFRDDLQRALGQIDGS